MIIFDNSDFVAKTGAIMTRVNMGLGNVVETEANMIRIATVPKTPIESGELRGSGQAKYISTGPVAISEVEFSAYNPRNGYPYGALQHEVEFNHPRGGEDHFLLKTMDEQGVAVINSWGIQVTALIG